MIIKNKKLLIIVIIFVLFNLIDLITSLFIGPAETNPVYNLFNSFIPIIIIKLLLCGLVFYVYYYNHYKKDFYYFIFIFILLEGIILLIYGIYTNINVILNPKIIEYATYIPTSFKTKQYFNLFKYYYIYPLIISSLSFLLFSKTKNEIKL